MNFFLNLFKKRNFINSGIVTFGNLITIPKREDFRSEDSFKIDQYKEEYLKVLSQEVTLTSNAIHDDSFQEELNMNLDLLMKVSFNEEIEILSENEKRMKSLITYTKLELYLNKIMELENVIKYRIVALIELKKELIKNTKIKYILNRRNCINDEINNLMGILCIFNNQKYAIYNKVNACSIEYKTFVDNNDIKTDDNYLTNRYQKLLEYGRVLLSENVIQYVNSFDDTVIKIATLEQELEMFVYNNCKDIDKMRNKLNDFVYRISHRNRLIHELSRDVNTNTIKELEAKFRVLDEFGRNIVTEEDLYNFYKMKFDYKVMDIYTNHDTPLFLKIDDSKRDYTEYSIYEQIILDMIGDLVTDEKHILTSQFNIKDKDFWDRFKALLNPGSNTIYDSIYDVNAILTNNLNLAFLLATHNQDLFKFFHNYNIKTPLYIQSFIDDIVNVKNYGFKLEEEIPLDTFSRIYNIIAKMPFHEGMQKMMAYYGIEYFEKYSLRLLADIYRMIHEDARGFKNDKLYNHYHIPEGIVSLLRIQKPTLICPMQSTIIDTLVNPGQDKCVYTPQSLKELNTSALDEITMTDLVLNEGLQKFYVDKRSKLIKVNTLVIPSSLEIEEYDIDIYKVYLVEAQRNYFFGFDLDSLREIHFTNFKESKILNNKDFIKILLSKVITICKKDNKRFFKCNLNRIILWNNNFYHGANVIIEDDDIDEIITKISRSYRKIYNKELIHNSISVDGIFMDLLIAQFIAMVYKKSGITLCESRPIKVLKKQNKLT